MTPTKAVPPDADGETIDATKNPVAPGTSQTSGINAETFKDAVIEVIENGEEVVVTKQVWVVEEVVLTKNITEHDEIVRGTVRSVDVDVEELDAQAVRDKFPKG